MTISYTWWQVLLLVFAIRLVWELASISIPFILMFWILGKDFIRVFVFKKPSRL